MTDRIEPALTPEEWSRESVGSISVDRDRTGARLSTPDENGGIDAGDLPAAIALANAALPDSDPRKITREDVVNLRGLLSGAAWAVAKADIARLADALESYLPPEP